jgi:hypothetical protein
MEGDNIPDTESCFQFLFINNILDDINNSLGLEGTLRARDCSNGPLSNITSFVMLLVPPRNISIGNSDQSVSVGSIIINVGNFSPDGISLPLGQQIHPNNIVKSANKNASVEVRRCSSVVRTVATYIAIPTTQYVAYQKLTSPA